MKLRIRGNSLRLRLLKSEVKRLKETHTVTETVSFGSGHSLVYTLAVEPEAASIVAQFDQSEIRVTLPATIAERWVTSDEVSLTAEQSTSANGTLKILVEKDFACLKPRTSPLWEDESDAFPNPNPSCGHTP